MGKTANLKRLALLGCLTLTVALNFGARRSVTAQDPLTPQENRGKHIYVQGSSPSGKEIFAYLGDASMEVPGSAMPCANCHGLDGQGKPEAGVTPSNITWEALSKPYGVTHSDGRKHPAYTDRGLEFAITRGTDPAGNKLLSVMPRYVMTREDLTDLVIYLKRLGNDRDPGISQDRIVIGTAGPTRGALTEMGQAIRAVTVAFFDELNSQGGVFNRRFDVKFSETAETPDATRANFERLIKEEKVFAITGAFVAGAEKEVMPLMSQQGVPLIGPLTLYPQTEFPLNRQVFYLLSGIDEQARAMIAFVASKQDLKPHRIAVVFAAGEINSKVVAAIKERSKKEGLGEPLSFDYTSGRFDIAGTVAQLKLKAPGVIFFLGSGADTMSFIDEANKAAWYPAIFLPSANAAKEIFSAPAGFDGKLFFAFPTSPADQSEEGIREFRALAEKYKLPTHHMAVQISTYSSAKILVEAMKRVGRDLSREKLIQALDGLYEYQTGLTPAITYGPNRRIGALGAYLVKVDLRDKKLSPASGWINLN